MSNAKLNERWAATPLGRETADYVERWAGACLEVLEKSRSALLTIAAAEGRLDLSIREDYSELQDLTERGDELGLWAAVFLNLYSGANFTWFVGLFRSLIELDNENAGLAGQACYYVLQHCGKDESDVLRGLYAELGVDHDGFQRAIELFTVIADRSEHARPFVEIVLDEDLAQYGYFDWAHRRAAGDSRTQPSSVLGVLRSIWSLIRHQTGRQPSSKRKGPRSSRERPPQ